MTHDAEAERDRQRLMLQQMPGFAALLTGAEHRYEYANDAYMAIAGGRELVGRAVREAFPDIEGQGFFELLDRVYTTGEPFAARDMPVHFAQSGDRIIDLLYQPIRDDSGVVTGIFVGGYDNTERSRAESALRKSEARLRVFAALSDRSRESGDSAGLPRAAAEILGRALAVSRVGYGEIDDEVETLDIEPEWTAPDVPAFVDTLRLRDYGVFIDSLRQGESVVIADVRDDDRTAIAADALETIGVRSFINVPFIEHGRLVAVLYVNHNGPRDWQPDELELIRDVAEWVRNAVQRRRDAAELSASEKRYSTLFEAIDAGFCIIELKFDTDGVPVDYRFVEINPAFERQTGLYGASGKWVSDVAPGLEQTWFEIYGRVAQTGEAVRFENFAEPVNRWFDLHAFQVGEHPHRVAVLFNDITARKLAEDRLLAVNETLEQCVTERTEERDRLWTLSEDLLARAHYAGMLLAVNPAWTKVLGWSEAKLLSWPYADMVHPDDLALALEVLREMGRSGQSGRFESRLLTAKGEWKPIGWTISPEPDGQNFIAVGRDLSEEKALFQTQEALRQSQKMEAIGQLTGGVAHDFNNLLMPILATLDKLERNGVGSERERRLISGGLQAAERARILVARLLAFSRRQPLQPSAVDVKALVNGIAELVEGTVGPRIKLVLDISEPLPAARADLNQLEMALLNLAVNSRDAMPEGGTLRISASEEIVGSGHSSQLVPGHYVRLSVADTGMGMDETTLAHAVEPFYSTKGIGKGTGLGLSMVHGLALQLGGALSIQSQPGAGANVDLWLPKDGTTAELAESTAAASATEKKVGVALLVDDEALVRMATADMLDDLGYEVIDTGSAEGALALLEGGLRPDLLVTDHLMPGMNGTDLARLVLARLPQVRVLIISGYAGSEGIDPSIPRLTKPFRQEELAANVMD